MFYYVGTCEDNTCFSNSLLNCNRVSWIKEDDKAIWHYNVLGNSENNACKIEVELLKIKEGTIDLENLQGEKMVCSVDKTQSEYPEKDISKCSGLLKRVSKKY